MHSLWDQYSDDEDETGRTASGAEAELWSEYPIKREGWASALAAHAGPHVGMHPVKQIYKGTPTGVQNITPQYSPGEYTISTNAYPELVFGVNEFPGWHELKHTISESDWQVRKEIQEYTGQYL